MTVDIPSNLPGRRAILSLPLMILLADILFWQQTPGLSLAVFAAALFAASLTAPPRPLAFVTLIMAVLPVIDYVRPFR